MDAEEQRDFARLGTRFLGGRQVDFGLGGIDRRQHLYVIGKSGTGKTTLLKNLAINDIHAGHGLAFIDPHGDSANEILDYIPRRRIEDVVFFNPSDLKRPIGFNPFNGVPVSDRHLVVSGIVSMMQSIWGDSWGPRLQYILTATLSALMECENVSFLGIQRMLSDKTYRAWVLRQVADPAVLAFWLHEFADYEKRFAQEAIAPIQNKVGQLLMSPHLRNILGQIRNRIDARFMMDNRRVFIADLSKGKLGEDKSNLLGAFLVTQFKLAALSRADMPEAKRRDFHLYVDEFQSFGSTSFISILSEARKYRLCLTLAHQYREQINPAIEAAVFGNVGSLVSFRVGQTDADVLERQFGNKLTARQFVDLANYEVCVKLLHGGEHGEPFVGQTFPPLFRKSGHREGIVRQSRKRYATKRRVVEERIRGWIEQWS